MAGVGINASELRNKSVDELRVMIEERSQELRNLRFQRAVARLEKSARFKMLKRERARILTVMNEKSKGDSAPKVESADAGKNEGKK